MRCDRRGCFCRRIWYPRRYLPCFIKSPIYAINTTRCTACLQVYSVERRVRKFDRRDVYPSLVARGSFIAILRGSNGANFPTLPLIKKDYLCIQRLSVSALYLVFIVAFNIVVCKFRNKLMLRIFIWLLFGRRKIKQENETDSRAILNTVRLY